MKPVTETGADLSGCSWAVVSEEDTIDVVIQQWFHDCSGMITCFFYAFYVVEDSESRWLVITPTTDSNDGSATHDCERD